MLIGFTLLAANNRGALRHRSENPPACSGCGNFLNIEPKVSYPPKGRTDLSATWDGVDIASEKFKAFCESNKFPGVVIAPTRNPKAFILEVKQRVSFDLDFRPVQDAFSSAYKCNVCNRLFCDGGCAPIFLKEDSKELEDGFYATDLHIAHRNTCFPLVLVGIQTALKMQRAKLTGISLRPIYQRSDFASWTDAPTRSYRLGQANISKLMEPTYPAPGRG